jgi:hypothetical protein
MKNITKALYPEVRAQFSRNLRKARRNYRKTPNKTIVLFVLQDMLDTKKNMELNMKFEEGLETCLAHLHTEVWRELCINLWVKLVGKVYELEISQLCILR